MKSSRLIQQLLGESAPVKPAMGAHASKAVRGLLGEGVVNIHIHNDGEGAPVTVSGPSSTETTPDEIVSPGDRPEMPPQRIAGGAKNYVFKVKRDKQGNIVEIYATKLG